MLLEHDIQNSLRLQDVVMVVFFDIQAAFDCVPHSTILRKMKQLGLQGRILNWYSEFLKDRKFQVVVDGNFSDSYGISTGVPQGAVSSPTLFNMAMHDIPSSPEVTTSIFADDVSMYTVQNSFQGAANALQTAIDSFSQWCSRWGLEVNPGKSVIMVFSRKRNGFPPNLTYDNSVIPTEKVHRFLGLHLDSPTLTWSTHIVKLRQTCAKRLNILKIAAHSKFGCSRRVLLKFYISCIRSVMDYGYPIYGSTSPSNYKHLQIIQNSAVRTILGAWRSSPIIDMHAELALPMLVAHHKNVTLAYLWKIQNYPVENPVFIKLADPIPNFIYNHDFLFFLTKFPLLKGLATLQSLLISKLIQLSL